MQGTFPENAMLPLILQQHFALEAGRLPRDQRCRLAAVHACSCTSVLQARSLSTDGKARWCCNGWQQIVAQNPSAPDTEFRCPACCGASKGGNSLEHAHMVKQLKQLVEQHTEPWWFVIELQLQPGAQSSAKADVTIVHAHACTWKGAVAVEIDPAHHSTNPLQLARAADVEHSDEAKEKLFQETGMGWLRLSHLSYAGGAINARWQQLFLDELNAAVPRES